LDEVKTHKIHKRTNLSLEEIAKEINPQVRGWINYFRHFRISDMYSTLHHIDRRLVPEGNALLAN